MGVPVIAHLFIDVKQEVISDTLQDVHSIACPSSKHIRHHLIQGNGD